MRASFLHALVAILGASGPAAVGSEAPSGAAPPTAAASPSPGRGELPAEVAKALLNAMEANVGHTHDWLAAGDMKSAAKGAATLRVLVDLARAQGDDAAWKEATAPLADSSQRLSAAVRQGDRAASREALDRFRAAIAAAAAREPAGKIAAPGKPAMPIRGLMSLMEGIHADAKVALLVGDAKNAKMNAYVLSELGWLVFNDRDGEKWSMLSREFIAASLAAARSPSDDPAEVRTLLKAVSRRCEFCHDTW